eukprot:11211225-Lingulodinium_polyedra.AAC.1
MPRRTSARRRWTRAGLPDDPRSAFRTASWTAARTRCASSTCLMACRRAGSRGPRTAWASVLSPAARSATKLLW